MVWVDAGDLLRAANPTELSPAVLASGFGTAFMPVHYANVDGWLYYSDGARKGKISPQGVHYPWGVEVPFTYSAGASAVGNFKAGRYMVCCTYRLVNGEEGAPGPVQNVDVPENGGVLVSTLPTPTDPLITHIVIYMSDWSSEQLYRHSVVPVGTPSWNLTKLLTSSGAALRAAIGTEPMVACRFPVLFNGRLFGAVGPFVVFTEALDYGVIRRATNFYGFGADVNLLIETLDGLYVGADQTYFIANAGDRGSAQRPVLAYSAISNSLVRDVDNVRGNVAWFSERGFVIAGPGGVVKNVMDDAIAPKAYTTSRAFWRAQDGIKQLVAVAGGGGPQDAFVASDFIDAELVRGVPQ
jgi:hypothetical protein